MAAGMWTRVCVPAIVVGLLWTVLGPPGADSLLVGSFNIQVFGRTKADKPHVMDILVKIVNRYDILFIQEIRDSSGTAIVKLLDQVNSRTDDKFSMKLSARLGRTDSKEQYAYFYREGSGLAVTKEMTYDDGDEALNTVNKTVDTFEREPYIVAFSSSNTVLKEFAFVGIHVDPDSVVKELTVLEKVIADVKDPGIMGINDVMAMGDMNADCGYFPQKYWDDVRLKADTATYQWLIADDADTTVAESVSSGDCAYDRFISTGSGFLATAAGGVVPGSAKVFRFDIEYGLSHDQTRVVSDHYPIEFQLKSALGSIEGVYVAVSGPSLKKEGVDYYMQNYDVFDESDTKVAVLYTNDARGQEMKVTLDTMVNSGVTTWPMVVQPVKNKYGGKQKCTLYYVKL